MTPAAPHDSDAFPSLSLPDRIHAILDPWVAKTPDAIAVEDPDARLSFRQLHDAVETAAQRLQAQGLRGGDRLLVLAENCIPAVVLLLAASRLDVWASIVNARLSQREITNFIEHSGARLAAFTTAVSKDALAHAERLGATEQDWPGVGRFHLATVNPDAVPEPVQASGKEQVAVMIYTSGTSGNPKGVMLTHSNLLFVGDNGRRLRRLTSADRIYGVLPMSHVYGLSAIVLTSLLVGATLVLVPRFTPDGMAAALATGGITVLHGVPAMYAKLLEWGARPGNTLAAPSLRIAQGGGAPLDQSFKDAFEAAVGVTLHNGYGMTESSPSISQTRVDAPRKDCSVGQPVPGIEVRLIGDNGQPVAPGEVGELHVRGPNVMKGYYHAPDLTREAVDAEGWLNTGDMARQEADGALFIVGRSKELIIRSGFNVYPIEVEQAINSHADVVHCAVVGRSVPGNEEVVAYVEPVPGRGLTVDALAAYLRERLSPYKIPAEIVLLEQLPATPTGKILKNQLKLMAAGQA